MAKKTIGNDEPCCSFCGKPETKVEHLIAAPGAGVYICDECVAICREQLQEQKETVPDKVALLPPEQLKAELDKYIIFLLYTYPSPRDDHESRIPS